MQEKEKGKQTAECGQVKAAEQLIFKVKTKNELSLSVVKHQQEEESRQKTSATQRNKKHKKQHNTQRIRYDCTQKE